MLINFTNKKIILLFLTFISKEITTQSIGISLTRSKFLTAAIPAGLLKTIATIKTGKQINSRKFILHGPPGNGKTSLAEYFATEINADFKPYMGSSIVNTYQNSGSVNIDNIFNEAVAIATKKKVVVFIDEIDAIADKKMEKAYLNATQQLWQWLDKTKTNQNLYVFLATNLYDELNPILKTRFSNSSNVVEVLNPNQEVRKKIINFYCNENQINLDQSAVDQISTKSEGLSIREIEDIIGSVSDIPKDKNTTLFNQILDSIDKQKSQKNKSSDKNDKHTNVERTFLEDASRALITGLIWNSAPLVVKGGAVALGFSYLYDKTCNKCKTAESKAKANTDHAAHQTTEDCAKQEKEEQDKKEKTSETSINKDDHA